ncbi:MAG: glycosyltransferase family 2 protein [Candidatus Dormibacterales bacterium]
MNGAAPAADPGAVPEASVVIVNHDGIRYLDDCLSAVLAQEIRPGAPGAGFEVILVDNASADGSVEHVHKRFPCVRIVPLLENRGFAGGNNAGIREAGGRHIVLLNNDTRVRPGWLKALLDAAASDGGAGAITAKLVFMDPPGTIQNAGSLMLSDGSGADRGFREADRGQYDRREEVFGACGASVLYRREMLADVGGFDDSFFMYYEDADLNWRMRLRGWRVVYEPAAVVDHVHAGTSGEWSPFFTFHVDRNRLLMITKNAPGGFVARAYVRFMRMAFWNAFARGMLWPARRRLAPLKHSVLRGLGREAEGAFEPAPRPSGPAHGSGLGRARIHVQVAGSLLAHMPEVLAKRRVIRAGRRVPDAEVERWFVRRELWRGR